MNYANLYADFLKKFLHPKRKLKVIFDCSNGTTGLIVKRLKVKGLRLVIINANPDGNFPAHGPNPLIPGAMDELEARVKKEKADLGVIFDADGDRVFFIDNRGRPVDAHETGYILAQVFKPPFVVSEISSWRLKKLEVKSLKFEVSDRDKSVSGGLKPKTLNLKPVFISPVGHYFFKNLMRKEKASLGLEHSGHFYFRDFFYCDSGILAAVEVINFVSGLENGLADWLDALPKYYRSGEINFRVDDNKKILDKLEKIYGGKADKISKLDGLTMEFGRGPSNRSGQNSGEFWFNVRASNTENLLRLNVEAADKKVLKKKLEEIKRIIR